jgi:hypothetical protein
VGENVLPEAHLHTPGRYEHPPPGEIPEPAVQHREEDQPGDRPDDPLSSSRRRDPVDRFPGHPGDEEPEEAGHAQEKDAPKVRPPVAAEVGAQGEKLADGRSPYPRMVIGAGVKQSTKSRAAIMPIRFLPGVKGTSS